jgi:Fe-S-cluster containining protein
VSDWFDEGVPFHCTACGDCCTGEPGAVWVNDDDIARLAAHFGTTPVEFERDHVRIVGVGRSLFERFNGDCEFFDNQTRACGVYVARPTQCRTFPWWPQLIESRAAWQGVCEACEGARVTEPIVSVEEIRARAAETLRARARGVPQKKD